MKQRASTQLTFFWKFVFPGLFAIPFGLGAIALVFERDWMGLPFAVVALLFGSSYVWFCPRYMAVEFDDEFLYISNFSREIQIPWAQVERMRRLVLSRWPTYVISFRKPTKFGRKIFFSIPFHAPLGYDTGVIQTMQDQIRTKANA